MNEPIRFIDATGAIRYVTPAEPLPTTGSGGGGGGGASTIADGADVALGATTATAAGADGTGDYSLLQAAKRGLLNWAALLARIPALVSGRIPVVSNVTLGAGASDATTQRITLATDGAGVSALNNIDAKTPALLNTRQPVETLGAVGVSRQLAAGAASANTALTTTCRRISIYARLADIRYTIGSSSQTANASTSHWINNGERLDVVVPATPNIAVIRAASADAVLEVTELV